PPIDVAPVSVTVTDLAVTVPPPAPAYTPVSATETVGPPLNRPVTVRPTPSFSVNPVVAAKPLIVPIWLVIVLAPVSDVDVVELPDNVPTITVPPSVIAPPVAI